MVERALAGMSATFDRMYVGNGPASIPPENLLQASLLMALFLVRSELSRASTNSATKRAG